MTGAPQPIVAALTDPAICPHPVDHVELCCTEPIQIFDCIEFNRRFRYGDVAGEIAFLAMDLDRLGRSDLAVCFLNAYLEASGDYDAVPLLDFYRAYRAFVRGKVLGARTRGVRSRAADTLAAAASSLETARERIESGLGGGPQRS